MFKRGVVQFRSSILLYDCSAGGKYTRPRGGGFFIACEDFWRMFDHSVLSCVFFSFSFKVEIRSCLLLPLFMPGSVHSVSAS